MLFVVSLHGQTLTQTIRGRVIDTDTRSPLVGATIIVMDTDPVIGTVTDPNGAFHLSDIPVRRQGIKVSYIGYEEKVFNNLMVVSGKELVLNVELEEKIQEVDEVVIKAWSRKDQPINDMASVSARSFTIEETERFAGSLGDPARLVANYAGVVYAGDSRNDIVIRGNSPMGLLWRLDGVEIPNPNHFAALGTTGGAISMINEGTGRNYGLELTLEKFLDKGYYFLLTTSLYDSKYEAVDGVVRNTSFNGNYVVNALGGKEFNAGKNSMITLDLKSILAGGKRYIPILEAESLAQKEAVYDWDKAYEQKHNPYFRIANISWDPKVIVEYGDKAFNEDQFLMVDPSFFTVFDYKLISGSEGSVLSDIYSAVITVSNAEKYFGEEDPVGKIIRVDGEYDFEITGVITDPPFNSHFEYDFLISFENLERMYGKGSSQSWGGFNYFAYLLLKENVNWSVLEKKIKEIKLEVRSGYTVSFGSLVLQPLTDIHFQTTELCLSY